MTSPDRLSRLAFPAVMGVLNVTPDSFSDGGRFAAPEAALNQARRMVEAGAALVDVGGESTRPGATPVSVQEELDRVCPVVERVVRELDVPVSVDTSQPVVIREVATLGASLINDVRALRLPGALQAAADSGLAVCLMHMQGEPETMQVSPIYGDVIEEVLGFLQSRMADAVGAGIPREKIWLDPGFGFGKSLAHNLSLLKHLDRIVALGQPVLVGISRKSMLGRITGQDVDQRLAASLAAATLAMDRGAAVIRAHDVQETLDCALMVKALMQAD